jgi:exodeoxyribonuclease V alpha subunit
VDETSKQKSETLRGVLDHVTFRNQDTGFTIARLVREPDKTPLTIVGIVPACTLGETVEVTGEWSSHPTYGHQLRISEYRPTVPASMDGIRRYLGSGLIRGVGPVYADKIVEKFGEKTLEIITKQPNRLKEVAGIGTKRIRQIREAWQEQSAIRDLMLFLQHHEIPPGLAPRIFKKYGADAVNVVKHEPYRLPSDIWGVGFKTADQIAERIGVARDDPRRIAAGIRHALNKATEQGHTYLPQEELVDASVDLLAVPRASVELSLTHSATSGEIIIENSNISLPRYRFAEREIGVILREHIAIQSPAPTNEMNTSVIDRVEARTGVMYAPEQAAAILAALREGVLVVTGGPGTGKTTTTQGIVSELLALNQELLLCAPTGRAAKRLAEITRVEAKTIHRALGFVPGERKFQYDERHPLAADAVLVDEASMIDTELFLSLIRALKPSCRLILVGDADQLPSVGPGQVLKDVISSGVVPVVKLQTVFRQAQESLIVTNAHAINHGIMPPATNARDKDFFFLYEEDPAKVADTVADLVTRRLPFRYHLNRFAGIQVLTPMYRGETGANALNKLLQAKLNPKGESITRGLSEFRVGDKVIVTRNNYTKMVFNGDIGRIVGIDAEQAKVSVELNVSAADTTRVTYEMDELDELSLAYAISVHRSQGSEFPAVVMPITTQHFMMLQRNVLYTAVTRAKRLMVLVGSRKALAIAVRNGAVSRRYTWLAEEMRKAMAASDDPSVKEKL